MAEEMTEVTLAISNTAIGLKIIVDIIKTMMVEETSITISIMEMAETSIIAEITLTEGTTSNQISNSIVNIKIFSQMSSKKSKILNITIQLTSNKIKQTITASMIKTTDHLLRETIMEEITKTGVIVSKITDKKEITVTKVTSTEIKGGSIGIILTGVKTNL